MGEGIAEVEGKKIRVLGGLPGEELEVSLWGRRRRVAIPVEIVVSHPRRTEPKCPLFPRCTGCQLQHVDYEFQLDFKRKKVEKELGMRVKDPLPCGEWEYRNHARLTCKRNEVGFVNKYTNEFIRVDKCWLMDHKINQLLGQIQGRCKSSMVSIRVGVRTGEYLIQPELPLPDVATGQPFYHELLLGRRFRVSSPSFFQPNTQGAETMVRLVREWIGSADKVMDAYAGVGTFSALLADLSSEVIAVEESPSAEKDASFNLRGISNVRFIRKKVEEVLPTEGLDVLILDPPRQGCSRAVLEAINQAPPKRIIYVSCNPVTMARDIRHLEKFSVDKVQPLDFFAQTQHIEVMALLVR